MNPGLIAGLIPPDTMLGKIALKPLMVTNIRITTK